MLCPDCRKPLVIVECEGVELDLCLEGQGLWFDKEELNQLFALFGLADGPETLENRLAGLPAGKSGSKRRCPRCGAAMHAVNAPGAKGAVILDRCPAGHGIWFDQGELHEILTAELDGDDPALERVRRHLGHFIAPGTEDTK